MTKRSTFKVGQLTIREVTSEGARTGLWMIDCPPGFLGEPKRRRLRCSSKTAAQTRARDLLKQDGLEQTLARTGKAGYSLDEILPRWEKGERTKIEARRKRTASLDTDLRSLAHVRAFMGAEDIGQINPDRITEYQAARARAGAASVTINTELRKLRAVLNWCRDRDLLKRLPKFHMLPEPPVDYEVPTPEEVMLILEQLPPRLRTLFRLMIETGLRKSEAYRLRWENLDLDQKLIRVTGEGDMTPKTLASYRKVPFGDGLAEDLLQLDRASPWVFPSQTDPTRHLDNCRKALASAVTRSGVTRNGRPIQFTPKIARKAFSTYMVLGGVALPMIKKLIGHSPNSRVTEKHYLHLPDQALREVLFELPLPRS